MIKPPYNFEIAMSALLSPSVVKEMIIREVEAQTGKKVTEIVARHQDGEFDGYQVFFEADKKITRSLSSSSSKEFIKIKWDGE
jgi:hypothetical protein